MRGEIVSIRFAAEKTELYYAFEMQGLNASANY